MSNTSLPGSPEQSFTSSNVFSNKGKSGRSASTTLIRTGRIRGKRRGKKVDSSHRVASQGVPVHARENHLWTTIEGRNFEEALEDNWTNEEPRGRSRKRSFEVGSSFESSSSFGSSIRPPGRAFTEVDSDSSTGHSLTKTRFKGQKTGETHVPTTSLQYLNKHQRPARHPFR